jgi:hypothetical protein
MARQHITVRVYGVVKVFLHQKPGRQLAQAVDCMTQAVECLLSSNPTAAKKKKKARKKKRKRKRPGPMESLQGYDPSDLSPLH